MSIERTSGVEFDGSSVFMVIGTKAIRAVKASYGDSVEKGDVYEMGNQLLAAVTPGQYKPELAKVTFRNSVYRAEVLPRLPMLGSANSPTSVVIQYTCPGIGTDSDLWKPCWIVGTTISPESSNKGIEVELTFKVQQYFWGDTRTTKNAIAGSVAVGINRF